MKVPSKASAYRMPLRTTWLRTCVAFFLANSLLLVYATEASSKDSIHELPGKTSKTEKTGDKILLGIGVLSKASHLEHRQLLRETIGAYPSIQNGTAKLAFFIATPKNDQEKR